MRFLQGLDVRTFAAALFATLALFVASVFGGAFTVAILMLMLAEPLS